MFGPEPNAAARDASFTIGRIKWGALAGDGDFLALESGVRSPEALDDRPKQLFGWVVACCLREHC
jgi:hypothetical protein